MEEVVGQYMATPRSWWWPNQALVDSDCILLKLVWVQIKKNYLQKGYPAHGGGGSGVVSFVRSVVGQKRYS